MTRSHDFLNEMFGGLRESRFKYLLLALVFTLFIMPPLQENLRFMETLRHVLPLLLFLWVMAGALNLSRSNKPVLYLGLAIGLFVLASHLLFIRNQAPLLLTLHHFSLILLLAYYVLALVKYMFVCRAVTGNTIYAALCAYLLLALVWGLLYEVISLHQPGSFTGQFVMAGDGQQIEFGNRASFYFSLVTITTLGYGDINPVSATARMATTAEAFTGQMFIAVTIARLVGIHAANTLQTSRRQ